MTLESGLARQIGLKKETAFGTPVTVDRFLPLVSESFSRQQARVKSAARLAGRGIIDSEQRKLGNISLAGQIGLELATQDQAFLWEFMLGALSAPSGDDPYTYTATPDPTGFTGLGFTMQLGRPLADGSAVQPFTFAGCKMTGWEIAAETGDNPITLGSDVVGTVDQATATALAAASYTEGAAIAYAGHECTVAVGGSDLPSRSVTLAADLGMNVDRRKLGSRVIREPVVAGMQGFTGKLVTDFESMAQYNRHIAGTESAVVIAATDGDFSVTATLNVDFEEATVNAGDDDILTLEQSFEIVGDGSDADGITVVVVNSQSAA